MKKVGFILILFGIIILSACSSKKIKNQVSIGGAENISTEDYFENIDREEYDNTEGKSLYEEMDDDNVGKTFVSSNYEYTVLEKKQAILSSYIGNEESITIPEEIDKYKVVKIGDHAFGSCENLKKVCIPGYISEIGEAAFSGCKNLECIIIEEGVESICREAFSSCKITELSIPDSLVHVGKNAFGGINKELLYLKNGCFYIGKVLYSADVSSSGGSFNGQLIIEPGTKGIADAALDNPRLGFGEITDEKVIIPDGLKYIGEDAFLHQGNVLSFVVPDSVEYIGSHALLFSNFNYKYELWNNNDIRKIYGKSATTAEEYANKNGLNFVTITN